MGLGDLVQGRDRKHCWKVPCDGRGCCDVPAPSALLTWVSGQPPGGCIRILTDRILQAFQTTAGTHRMTLLVLISPKPTSWLFG